MISFPKMSERTGVPGGWQIALIVKVIEQIAVS